MISSLHADTCMPLRVDKAYNVAEGLRSFELVQADGSELPAFTPGAHIKVQTPSGALRKYSLCGTPEDRLRYTITVKREDAGQGGSASMHDQLKEGDTLYTAVPDNAFPLVENARAYLFIAGGIGITPILSMIRSFGELPPVPWTLIYLSRSAATTAFVGELGQAGLKKNVRIHHSEDGGEFDLWPALEKPNSAHVYCCGPRGLMDAVADMSGHWPSGSIHFESFGVDASAWSSNEAFTVQLQRSGTTIPVAADQSILEALRASGRHVTSSCESGTCGSCRTGLLAGDVEHRDMVLSDDEKHTNIMVCVSRARGGELVLDL